jgi:hypothetical protein
MTKIIISIDKETRDVKAITGKLTGSIQALKALGFKEINDEGDGLIHVKTFAPSTTVKAMAIISLFIRTDVNGYRIEHV